MVHTIKNLSLNCGEYPSLSKYSPTVGLPSSLSTRTADKLKRATSNTMRHMLRSKMVLGLQSKFRKLSPAHSNAPPSLETLKVMSFSITSPVRLCSSRNRRKLGYIGGLKTICERRAVRWLGRCQYRY